MPTLILTPRFTEDSQSLWRAASRMGWRVERLSGWRVPEDLLAVADPVLYLEGLFAPTIAEAFGMKLLEPPDDWLPRLPSEFRRREINLTTFGAARLLSEPAFIKPPNEKRFPARVYTRSELPDGFEMDSTVLVAEVVRWEKEFRCFVLDREAVTLSIYLRDGVLQRDNEFSASKLELAEAKAFVTSVLADDRNDLPRATVLDVGVISDRGWAVVEQNAAWGSGIYGCDPERVLEVLCHAAPLGVPRVTPS